MRCEICGSALQGCACPNCGFDLSQDRERYPTLAVDRRRPQAVWALRLAREKQLSALRDKEPAPLKPASPLAPETPTAEARTSAQKPAGSKRLLWLIPAALLLLVIGFFVVRGLGSTGTSNTSGITLRTESSAPETGDTRPHASDAETPVDTGGTSFDFPVSTADPPVSTEPPTETDLISSPKPIDEAALKAALDDIRDGLSSEWEIVVVDPLYGTVVTSSDYGRGDMWMRSNSLLRVFVMGAAFQAVADGELTEADVTADLNLMMTAADLEAGDQLVDLLGGRDRVKSWAEGYGIQFGFNRPLSGTSGKYNYTNAYNNANYMTLLCQGSLISAKDSRRMLDLLMGSPDADTYGLAARTNVAYGLVVEADRSVCVGVLGVIRLPNGRQFVISILVNEMVSIDSSLSIAGSILEAAVNSFTAADSAG